jgi:hypothetical protein
VRPARLLAASLIALAACSSTGGGGGATTSAAGGGGASTTTGGAGGSTTTAAGGATAGTGGAGGAGGATAGTGGAGGACTLTKPYSSQDADCDACAEAWCCAAINACYADPACDDGYVNCALACALDDSDAGVDPCLEACAKDWPQGKLEYDAAIGCADTKCAAECQ